jgi:hypothetical protein
VETPHTTPADREQRLLGAPARLKDAREVAALADLGDLQLDLARPGVTGEIRRIVLTRGDSRFLAKEQSWRTGSSAGSRRVGGEAPVPAFRPVVSSPPPSEPDVRVSPHPALHEHVEWRRFM